MILTNVVATKAVDDLIKANSDFSLFVAKCITRFTSCDWGELSDDDARDNDAAAEAGDERIFASYDFPKNATWTARNMFGLTENKLWIITEWDRSVTTILFPGDY